MSEARAGRELFPDINFDAATISPDNIARIAAASFDLEQRTFAGDVAELEKIGVRLVVRPQDRWRFTVYSDMTISIEAWDAVNFDGEPCHPLVWQRRLCLLPKDYGLTYDPKCAV